MKRVYFVRHGESEGNAGAIRQGAHSALSEKGRVQARAIAERCAKLPIEIIISSTMKRAEETARIIAEKRKVPVECSALFVERRRPTKQIGKPKDDPGALAAEKTIRENFHRTDFRFSDEENFCDLKTRARKALRLLEKRGEKNILVVTHGFFMRILAAYAVFGEALRGAECEQFVRAFHMENAGITVFGFDEAQQNPWWIWAWNDHAHLQNL